MQNGKLNDIKKLRLGIANTTATLVTSYFDRFQTPLVSFSHLQTVASTPGVLLSFDKLLVLKLFIILTSSWLFIAKWVSFSFASNHEQQLWWRHQSHRISWRQQSSRKILKLDIFVGQFHQFALIFFWWSKWQICIIFYALSNRTKKSGGNFSCECPFNFRCLKPQMF